MSDFKYLALDDPAPGVLRVRLDRGGRRNAFDAAMVAELSSVLGEPLPPVVVLGSTDPATFSAGGDLSLGAEELAAVSDWIFSVLQQLVASTSIVGAVVEGAAVGGGAKLVLASDLRIAGHGAFVSFAGVASGLALGTWGLPQLIGRGQALDLDLSLTGRRVGAEEAAAIGLFDRVVDDPMATALELAASIAAAPEGTAAQVKRLVDQTGRLKALSSERSVNASRHHTAAGTRR